MQRVVCAFFTVHNGKAKVSQIKETRAPMGSTMIELIMAIAVSSMLAAAMVGAMADTSRLSTSGQNQIIASALAQEQIDNIRNTQYNDLTPLAGQTFTLLVNRSASGQSGPAQVNPRPLLIDAINLDWRTPAEVSAGVSQTSPQALSEFNGTVTETVENSQYPNAVLVTVEVDWQEGTSARKYVVSTLVTKYGIHID